MTATWTCNLLLDGVGTAWLYARILCGPHLMRFSNPSFTAFLSLNVPTLKQDLISGTTCLPLCATKESG